MNDAPEGQRSAPQNGQRFNPTGRLGVFLFIACPLVGWLFSGPRTPDVVLILIGVVWLASIPMMLIGRQAASAGGAPDNRLVPRPTRLPSPEEKRRAREQRDLH